MKNEIKREKNNIKNHKTNRTDTGGLLTMKGWEENPYDDGNKQRKKGEK